MISLILTLLLIPSVSSAAVSRNSMLKCESSGGKYSAEVSEVKGDKSGNYLEVKISNRQTGDTLSTFPGSKDEDGEMNFKSSDAYIPGNDQTFEINKTTGLWTRSQNLDEDLILSFGCQ